MIAYVDTSALLTLLFAEAESGALRTWIATTDHTLVTSQLVHTEAHCAARRRARTHRPAVVDAAVAHLAVVALDGVDLRRAAAGPEALRAADAIHHATARRIGADAMLVYDAELAAAARAAGMQVIAPR